MKTPGQQKLGRMRDNGHTLRLFWAPLNLWSALQSRGHVYLHLSSQDQQSLRVSSVLSKCLLGEFPPSKPIHPNKTFSVC